MAKLKMMRFQTACLQHESKLLIEDFQKIGALHLEKYNDERFSDLPSHNSFSIYQKNLDTVCSAIEILSKYGAVEKKGMFSGRKIISSGEFSNFSASVDKNMTKVYEIINTAKKLEDASAEEIRQRIRRESLSIWRELDVPMKFTGTLTSKAFIGTLPGEYPRDSVLSHISSSIPDISEYEVECVYISKEISAVFILCHRSIESQVYSSLRQLGFVSVQDSSIENVNDQIKLIDSEIENSKNAVSECKEKLAYMLSYSDDLLMLHDYFSIKTEEYRNLSNAKLSSSSIILCGYVPQNACDTVLKIADKYNCAVEFSQPSEDEDVPVILKNNKFCEPVEGITQMYALPGKNDIDPSSVMAFFYYLLFGMMLSDAGYGVVMTLGTAFILWKTNVEGSMRKMLKMFFYCGISTTFWGALFGSWFGDIIPVVCTNFLGYETKPELALWFDPNKDPMKLLLFSFVIGICHLFLGLVTFGVIQWKNGNKSSAIFDTVPTIMLVLGAAPLAGSILTPMPKIFIQIGQYLAIAGVVLVVLTTSRTSKNIVAKLGGGLYGLYNVASGYLSDILSYSRLLALGLATGSIASVVNMIGVMPEGKVMKAIMLVVVFCIGHPLNMAINVLGAYVHANRLQFVELFSKFYEGGGRAFEPLMINTKYFKLKEEIKND